ncbi:MAG TPA: flagellar hook-associated protein FlgK [Gammaproteobacteria bacterium]|nr:flagellar hook-associated protein FlgK [Gammaproteobacteria bacterium]
MANSGDVLGIGVSGLLAFQRSLATTSHNISNVNTAGYSRQLVDLAARAPVASGNGYIGTGVEASTVRRAYDGFLTAQVRTTTSSSSQLDNYYSLASQVDNLLADSNTGLSPTLQSFFNALQGVANDPSSLPARDVLLSSGQGLTDRFHFIDQQLADQRSSVNSRLQNTVTEINSLATALANVNDDIATALGASSQTPNDLLDQRDELLNQLAQRVSVTTVTQDNGAVNVFIGNGQSLVIGTQTNALTIANNVFDPTRSEVAYVIGSSTSIISDNLTGGTLGSALDFRRQILDTAQNALGRVATGLATTFNAQHLEGLDLNNALGANFFTVGTPDVLVNSANTGSATVAAVIASVNSLTTSDYRLQRNADSGGNANYTLTRLTDNSVVTTYTPVLPAAATGTLSTVDGLTVSWSGGTLAVGDSFLIRPTRAGAEDISVALTDSRKIAAAAPIRTTATLANTGTADISTGEVLDATNASLLTTTTLNFTSATTYQINGAGAAIAYTSGANIDLNGWRVQITGTPAAGDVFTISKNTGGVSDNRNALLLGALQSQLTLGSSSSSYQGAYSQVVADVGSLTHQADIGRKAQAGLLSQVSEARSAVAGVNLDEEAANLVRLQQAYQASAQVISIASNLFQTLLDVTRR